MLKSSIFIIESAETDAMAHIKYKKYLLRITNDAREEEMENNMGEVNTMIGNLRNMALDMSSELDNQNQQVDRINRKVSLNEKMSFYLSERYIFFYKYVYFLRF